MESTCRTKTLQSIAKDIQKEKILLTHKLQRKEGQWNTRQKSDLIDSLLRNYPINPTYSIKEDGILSVIDGVQRLSTVRDYLDNKFALSKTLETVSVNGAQKEIAGKKFSKLDEDTKDALINCELQIYELTNCTEKDVREMFRRQNAGKPLNVKQLRSVEITNELNETIDSLVCHPLMDKLCTKTQRKNATDRDLIIQTLMLIETNSEHEYLSFRSKDIDCFLIWYRDNINMRKIDLLLQAMDKLNETYDEISLATTTIPMVLFSGYRIVADKKSFSRFIEILNQFIADYDTNEDYKKFSQNATSSKDNVNGRLNYFREMIKKVS